MSKLLFKKQKFVVLEARGGFIVYNSAKLWENGHTHVQTLKMCRTIIDLALSEKIPKSNDIWLLESVLRITSASQKSYRKNLIQTIDSLTLNKSNKL